MLIEDVTQDRSAPLNCAEVFVSRGYKHSTPKGVSYRLPNSHDRQTGVTDCTISDLFFGTFSVESARSPTVRQPQWSPRQTRWLLLAD
jgi:hypothetical protein